jgi:hypothetical protein
MVEMIADGHSGWIAESGDAEGLTKALRRALETPPHRIAEMGANAARSIREYCDNHTVVERHLRFRARVVARPPRHEAGSPDALRTLADHVARNRRRVGEKAPYADVSPGQDRTLNFREPLAVVRCLVGNPGAAVRVWKRVAAKVGRPARKDPKS